LTSWRDGGTRAILALRSRQAQPPVKYWLSTLADDIGFHRLVDYAKLRWRIEHDYMELLAEPRET
jgi:hypothetical protein